MKVTRLGDKKEQELQEAKDEDSYAKERLDAAMETVAKLCGYTDAKDANDKLGAEQAEGEGEEAGSYGHGTSKGQQHRAKGGSALHLNGRG